MFKTLSFGEILWDQFPDYKKPGGSPANLAYHLHLFGNYSYLISKVGNDSNGLELLEFLSSKGISTDYIQKDIKLPTGLVTVEIDDDNEPAYTIHQPSAWDQIEFTTDLNQLANTIDAFCFASLSQRERGSMKTVNSLIEKLPDHSLKIFDLNIRKPFINKSAILKNIEQSDVIKFNIEEYSIVGDWLGTKHTADKIIGMDSNKTVLVTLGSDGSELYNSTGRYHHKAYPIGGKGDFVGVGDAFLACFTHLKLKNIHSELILEISNRYAAFVASQKGSMPDIPQDILKRII